MRLPGIATLVVALIGIAGAAAPAASAISCEGYYGQTGTASDPFLVDSVAKLEAVDDCDGADVHFRQTGDLDLTGTPWVPLGPDGAPFVAAYDGGGHAIVGLTIDDRNASGLSKALFGHVDGGTVRNLVVSQARVNGSVVLYYAVVVADLHNGVVEDVTVRSSEVIATAGGGQFYFGGIVGGADDSIIRRVRVESLVIRPEGTGAPNYVGGIAGAANATTVSDAVVSNATLEGGADVGGIVGFLQGGSITDVAVHGGVLLGEQGVGGLAGGACDGVVARGAASASVTATLANAGGAIGTQWTLCPTAVSAANSGDNVVDVQATGSVTAGSSAGGLVGSLNAGTLRRSYATGSVVASGGGAGGLVGTADGGAIVDAYATGDATAGSGAGGLVGRMRASGVSIERAYATGRVRADVSAGGFIGDGSVCPVSTVSACSVSPSSIAASFWDTQTSGQAASAGSAVGRTTVQMRDRATFTGASWPIANGWEAAGANTWGICDGDTYPFLLRQYDAATQPCAGPPGAPLRPRLSANGGALRVAWEAPASDGGAPVSSYTATATAIPSGKAAARTCTTDGAGRRCVIAGLRNGVLYRVTITATNRKGTGAAATVAGRPRPSLTVLRVRVVDGAIVTRVRVTHPGRLQQVGRRGSAPACSTRTTVKRAGILVLTCPLNAVTRQAAPVTVRLTTRFRPIGWRWTTDVRAVRLGSTPPPVTG